MSYILNALRKSEQQRQADQIPTFEKSILETKNAQKSWKSPLILALIIFNLLTFAFFIWLYRENSGLMPTTAENTEIAIKPDTQLITEISNANKIPPRNSTNQIAQTLVQNSIPNKPTTISAIVKKRKLRLSERKQAPIPEEKISPDRFNKDQAEIKVATPSAPKNIKPVASLLKEETLAPPSTKPGKSGSKQQKPNTAIAGLDKFLQTNTYKIPTKKHSSQAIAKQAKKPRIPFLRELPKEFRRQVPQLNINVFAYADNPSERFVMIDMVKHTTGQQIATDMQLKEILNDSMIVKYQGKTFRIERP